MAVNGECSKLSPIFVACFSPKIYAIIQAPAIYLLYGSVQIKVLTSSAVSPETLAVHSLFTIQNTEAIKRNLRNVRKWRVFAQRVTYAITKNYVNKLVYNFKKE